MLSFLGGIVSGLISKVIGWLALIGIGERRQQAKDIAANEDTIRRQRDDATNAGPVDPLRDLDKL